MATHTYRPRRTVTPTRLRALQALGWRYSTTRNAWVHRVAGGRWGPVFTTHDPALLPRHIDARSHLQASLLLRDLDAALGVHVVPDLPLGELPSHHEPEGREEHPLDPAPLALDQATSSEPEPEPTEPTEDASEPEPEAAGVPVVDEHPSAPAPPLARRRPKAPPAETRAPAVAAAPPTAEERPEVPADERVRWVHEGEVREVRVDGRAPRTPRPPGSRPDLTIWREETA